MSNDEFFDESREQSRIKSRIVAKYFRAWAKVIIRAAKSRGNRIAYIDLFAGPGQYADGTVSTPVLILREALEDADMRKMLVTVFNDWDPGNAESLKETIDKIPGIQRLTYRPQIRREEVGAEIVKMFQNTNLVPTLLFVDPWGYRGLSLALINSVLRNWGCDCVFFFNYNRINAGLTNTSVRQHMDGLFGKERADAIRRQVAGLRPDEREDLIMRELSNGLADAGGKFVLRFAFKNEQGTRTKHYLIFTTKHRRGYEIMKSIMAKESSELDQGVPSFAHKPATTSEQLSLELSGPIDDLEEILLTEFAGQSITMQQIYEQHSVGQLYLERNYKKALLNLEAAGKIGTNPPVEMRRRGTFGPTVVATFPSKEKT